LCREIDSFSLRPIRDGARSEIAKLRERVGNLARRLQVLLEQSLAVALRGEIATWPRVSTGWIVALRLPAPAARQRATCPRVAFSDKGRKSPGDNQSEGGPDSMKRIASTAGGLALLLLLALPAITASGRYDEDFKLEEGFTSLFNGKDLTGWYYRGSKENLDGKTETADGRIKVENGVIVMMAKDNKGKGGIKDLYTIKSWPREFHLKLEFRASLKADSGVYVRGPQLQVRDFIRRNEHKHLKKFKNDGWNTLDIVVRNNQVVSTVNGKVLTAKDTLELTVEGGKAKAVLNGKAIEPRNVQVRTTAVAVCTCNGEPLEIMTNIPPKGGIGLQAETGKFEFRHIRVKELE
jgi:hypothetical protein